MQFLVTLSWILNYMPQVIKFKSSGVLDNRNARKTFETYVYTIEITVPLFKKLLPIIILLMLFFTALKLKITHTRLLLYNIVFL